MDNLGEYHIPSTAEACVHMLKKGVPCEIPVNSLPYILQYINEKDFANPRTIIESRNGRAYLTPLHADNELLQLATDLREGFHAALSYVVDPDDDDDWAELTEDEISERLCKAHRAADRLTQIERERAGQQRIEDLTP